ncbi:hypothetical protein D9619_013725 [Psilocybe cf. subviscida]|uniref:Uncharacterized protein n=1 Tax=Psilocybe cf. subviscida TaxID=2480587 RepID=A0A8H5EVG3_9AGAR|nr:hypothetical protein D9619_013725 [Psilocybe cf. subviscida]
MFKLTPYFDAYFNPLILDGFFMGFYFLLYVQAVWKLVKRKAVGLYLVALTILWMSLTSYFIFDWVRARNAFVINNDSPQTILDAYRNFANNTPATTILVATITSDGILIWRSYVFWEKKWTLGVLTPLLLASSVCTISFIAKPSEGRLFWALASIFSAATSIISTCLIAKKTLSSTGTLPKGNPYPKPIEILVQSAGLQSFVLLVNAMVSIVIAAENAQFGSHSDALLTQMSAYIFTCSRAAMGIAPTLIAFRFADEKPQVAVNTTSRSSPLSRLTFARSARRTDTETGADRTRISTIRFGTVQRDNDDAGILSDRGVDNQLERKESNEKVQHITTPDSD